MSTNRASRVRRGHFTESRAAITNMNASGRLVDPKGIAGLILMLCLPLSRDINGAALTIDGGTSA